jgi:hypothetical protein
MGLPNLSPSSRSVTLGDWPVKSYKAQNGGEIRMVYGDRRVGAELELTYENIDDAGTALFLSGYETEWGTFRDFDLPANAKRGWNQAGQTPFDPPATGRYRYAGPPQITSVRPGRSTVTVRLLSVMQ